eukprot:scaffold2670_cov408-Pavlova_lutheri.AAC.6
MYVPGLTAHLLSVSSMIGTERVSTFPKQQVHNQKGNHTLEITTMTSSHYCLRATAKTWHQRLGHMHPNRVKKLDLPHETDKQCEDCIQNKQTATAFKPKNYQLEPLDLLYMDVVGEISPPTPGRYTHYLSLLDHSTKLGLTCLMSSKGQASEYAREAINHLEKLAGSNKRVRSVRTDRGQEFLGNDLKEFLSAKGIQHELNGGYRYTFLGHPPHGGVFSSSSTVDVQVLLKASDPRAVLTPFASGHRRGTQGAVSSPSIRVCPTSPSWVQVYTTAFLVLQRSRVEQYTPQQNDAERYHRDLREHASTMLNSSNLPSKYWGEAIKNYTHTRNLIPPSDPKDHKSPYEKLSNRKQSVKHLRVFGCATWVLKNSKQLTKKFDARSEKGIFLGYENTSTYRVLVNNSLIISRNVKFDETQKGEYSPKPYEVTQLRTATNYLNVPVQWEAAATNDAQDELHQNTTDTLSVTDTNDTGTTKIGTAQENTADPTETQPEDEHG